MSVFRMPSLGADMEAATLVSWLVQPGARVGRGDIVAVVETAKGAIEIEIFENGTITALLATPGQTLPVGAPLAEIAGATAEAQPTTPSPACPGPPPAHPVARTERQAAPAPSRVRATPAARRRAAALDIPLERLRGTGVDGAICLADVTAAKPAGAGFDPASMRAAIATAMGRAKREIPHYYLNETIDLTPALDHLAALNATREPPARILPAALLLRAIALAVAETPALNGFWEDGAFRAGSGVHVGWAVSLRGGGLIAPAIRDTDRLGLEAMMAALADVVSRARSFSLRGSELGTATITVTSLGDRGAESVLPIIHPPQVAMLGIGRVVTRPWVVGEAVLPRRVVVFTLAADHRASDGHAGGLLLGRIAAHLARPETL
jgi:pyruvate dehydrogenase E2 component (dihydrolipoamide acetyltransferase)